jgi:hypothetical protein
MADKRAMVILGLEGEAACQLLSYPNILSGAPGVRVRLEIIPHTGGEPGVMEASAFQVSELEPRSSRW